MNQAILVGQLGNDATRPVTKSGLAVIQFPLVTKRRSTNSAGDTIESSTWHHIVYWGSRCTAPGFLDTSLGYAAWRSSYSSRASSGVR